MAMIEGIGNEVVQFFGVVICLAIGALAWWSTGQRPNRFRTAVVLERNVRNVYRMFPLPTRENAEPAENAGHTDERDGAEVQSAQDREMSSIVNAMDAETSILRNRRLAYFSGSEVAEPDKPEDDVITDDRPQTDESEGINASNIKIRLKFLNDDLKIVDADPKETLDDFRRRNFKDELGANKVVRLIFNGKVLQRDSATLESSGLFDDCVVHCLVNQSRSPPAAAPRSQPSPNRSDDTSRTPSSGNREERDWDLSHVLFTMLASLLSVAWYIHIRFSSLFGVAASFAMLSLTAIYVVAVMCVYFPEARPLRRRSPQETATE